jgi:hypothetical protein
MVDLGYGSGYEDELAAPLFAGVGLVPLIICPSSARLLALCSFWQCPHVLRWSWYIYHSFTYTVVNEILSVVGGWTVHGPYNPLRFVVIVIV